MKVLFLYGEISQEYSNKIYEFLINQGEEVTKTTDSLTVEMVRGRYDMIVSYGYCHILKKEIIDLFSPSGNPKWNANIINLHISLLPWNRGSSPNFWSFVENTPKGVTIHLIDEGIDTGKILLQEEVHFDETDEKNTLRSTYGHLQYVICQLFIDNWNSLKSFQIEPRVAQIKGSYHTLKMLPDMDFLPNGWDTTIVGLQDLYRAHLSSMEGEGSLS